MKRFAAKIQRKCAEPIPKGCAIFLMIAGIFLGSVFLYGAYTSKVRITRDDAVSVTADMFHAERYIAVAEAVWEALFYILQIMSH